MRKSFAILLLLAASLPAFDKTRLDAIDGAVEKAIARKEIPGAVVLVLHGDDIVYRKAFGNRALEPKVEPMTVDTIFDMASITKPVATGTSIHKLIEMGKLKTTDTVAKHWPEFAANGKDKVTIEHCLLHTSGLTADNSIKDYANGREEAIKKVAGLKLEAPPGTRFKYSDVGFIVLGVLVERISGEPLDVFATKNVFEPLAMGDSNYLPTALRGSFNVANIAIPDLNRIAPTGQRDKKIIRGFVHDPRAFAMDGVAGHAGLFSTADDLARYCRMLMNGEGVLSKESFKRFTEPHKVPGGQRSLGWDVATGFSGQRGNLFPAGEGFGHTGFTGTSIWIDPSSKTAIIILTNRVHPNDKGNASPLRREVANIVASATDGVAARRKPVKTGLDLMAESKFAALKGKNVGIVTNHTGKTADGTSIIDAMTAAGVNVVALFSPEHGIRGEKDEKVGDSKDEKTGLPIYSLYGQHRKPTAKMLEGIDTLVYDIQDIGCRFYTYISTLGMILEAGAENKLDVFVFDRPNPIGGSLVEGPLLDDGISNFVAYHKIPLRHGLTVGELAQMFKAERKLDVKLQVVKCQNWRRGETFDHTGLPWRNPSPNMRHLIAAVLYPGIGLIEFTNVSVGRGTERPFEWIGAPWIDGRKLASALNAAGLPGVSFLPTSRTPSSSKHAGKECHGVDIIVTDWNAVKPVELGITLAVTLRKLFPKEWDTTRLNTLLLHKATLAGILAGKPAPELNAAWQADAEAFRDRRKKFLIYPQ